MAQEVLVRLVCDKGTDRHEAQSTMSYAFAGQTYELDVCDKHAKEVDKTFEALIKDSRRATTSRKSRQRSGVKIAVQQPPYDEKAARTWAKLSGLNVKDSGRLSPTTIKAWREAGSPGV